MLRAETPSPGFSGAELIAIPGHGPHLAWTAARLAQRLGSGAESRV